MLTLNLCKAVKASTKNLFGPNSYYISPCKGIGYVNAVFMIKLSTSGNIGEKYCRQGKSYNTTKMKGLFHISVPKVSVDYSGNQ